MSSYGVNVERVTVKVSPDQMAWLNEAASSRATSVSDVVRRLIDETRGAYITPSAARVADSRPTEERDHE
jgi:hypothetical protein